MAHKIKRNEIDKCHVDKDSSRKKNHQIFQSATSSRSVSSECARFLGLISPESSKTGGLLGGGDWGVGLVGRRRRLPLLRVLVVAVGFEVGGGGEVDEEGEERADEGEEAREGEVPPRAARGDGAVGERGVRVGEDVDERSGEDDPGGHLTRRRPRAYPAFPRNAPVSATGRQMPTALATRMASREPVLSLAAAAPSRHTLATAAISPTGKHPVPDMATSTRSPESPATATASEEERRVGEWTGGRSAGVRISDV
uniref:Uncharacterized protein n=1 Tax=Oryza barthii TaxID=65489 RepID=A0A0D3G3M3_9ORYZ